MCGALPSREARPVLLVEWYPAGVYDTRPRWAFPVHVVVPSGRFVMFWRKGESTHTIRNQ